MLRSMLHVLFIVALTFSAHLIDSAAVAAVPFDRPGIDLPDPDQKIDPVAPIPVQARLSAGRIAQLPVSWFSDVAVPSNSGLDVRTVCLGDGDTGLLVRSRERTRFNDNSPLAGGNGKGSYVRLEASGPLTQFYSIVVFSMRRGTADCSVESSTDGGQHWTSRGEDSFGGTLVDVGPLRAGDTLEAQVSTAGDDDDPMANRTRLLLFNPYDEARATITALDGGLGGWNPRIRIPDNGWRDGPNFVLVGKISRSKTSNSGVETRVDLVHGPLAADAGETPLGEWRWLDVGRYYAWVHAKTTMPIGDTSSEWNSAKNMPTEWFCPDEPRGRLDRRAFTMGLERREGEINALVRSRAVRLAQMGAAANQYNLFLIDFQVQKAGSYRVSASPEDDSVTFYPKWKAHRNADASELTVASYNTLYDDGHNHRHKTLNASNLLATRGSIWPTGQSISAPADQAPFQWEADVIGLQELRKGDPSGPINPWDPPKLPLPGWRKYVDLFRDEAEFTGSRRWSYVWGRDEKYTYGTDGLGPLFVASPFYPGANGSSIDFPDAALEQSGCEVSSEDPTWVQCELDEEGYTIGEGFNAILGKIAVRRFGASSERPIVVVNLHLQDAAETDDRPEQLESLMRILDRLLKAQPRAFNQSGSSDPEHHQNRIIVMGDFNQRAHHCGEHYWLLRGLREHFGYAMDSAMGAGDYDMHDEAGSFANWVDSNDWKENPSAHPNFPWWLSTYRGTDANGRGRTERYDAIMLVGKGWAYDDPVIEYEVMNDRSTATPMSLTGAAVEQWHSSNLVTDGYNSKGYAAGYRPNYRLSLPPGIGSSRPFVPGESALDSDHAPIRARLRIFVR